MKDILKLTNEEAKTLLLKRESYSNISLPEYFSFQELLDKSEDLLASEEVAGEKKNDFDLVAEFENTRKRVPQSASKLNTDWQQKGASPPPEEDIFHQPPPPAPSPKIDPQSPSL